MRIPVHDWNCVPKFNGCARGIIFWLVLCRWEPASLNLKKNRTLQKLEE